MTPLKYFRNMMRDRRNWPRGSLDWQWRTNAARQHYWNHIGKPTSGWAQ